MRLSALIPKLQLVYDRFGDLDVFRGAEEGMVYPNLDNIEVLCGHSPSEIWRVGSGDATPQGDPRLVVLR